MPITALGRGYGCQRFSGSCRSRWHYERKCTRRSVLRSRKQWIVPGRGEHNAGHRPLFAFVFEITEVSPVHLRLHAGTGFKATDPRSAARPLAAAVGSRPESNSRPCSPLSRNSRSSTLPFQTPACNRSSRNRLNESSFVRRAAVAVQRRPERIVNQLPADWTCDHTRSTC